MRLAEYKRNSKADKLQYLDRNWTKIEKRMTLRFILDRMK